MPKGGGGGVTQGTRSAKVIRNKRKGKSPRGQKGSSPKGPRRKTGR